MTDSPFPELKKTATIARHGRPFDDPKPPPSAPVWAVIQGFASYWTLMAAIELGVFDALREARDRTPADVARRLTDPAGISPAALTPVLDSLVAMGFVDQTGGRYSLTTVAERYLCTDGPASMAALVGVAPGPHENWTRLAATVRAGTSGSPIERDPVAFYGPLVTATFPTQLRVAGRLSVALGWARRPALRVLDLGAGRAPWALSVLQHSPGSTAVVNDIAGIVELAAATLADHGVADRVELRAGDFHTIPIEPESYDVVVLGHVCRTEGDDGARRLVERAAAAVSPGGQVVVADYFAGDDHKRNGFGVLMGLTMLASTERGGTVTHGQMYRWLRNAGLVAIRLLEPIANNQVFVANRGARS